MRYKVEELAEDIKRSPNNMLALGRTIMANERTLLSFISASVGFLAAGIGLIKFLKNPFILGLGWVLVVGSCVFLIWGIKRYRHINSLLRRTYEVMNSTWKETANPKS